MARIRGLVYGVITGGLAYAYLTLWMRGDEVFDLVLSLTLGLAILSVVGTGRSASNEAADAAWQAAAPDLPPHSERVALEERQIHIPGPARPRRSEKRAGGRNGQPDETSESR